MENNTSQSESSNKPPFYKRRAFIYLAIACAALITTGIAAIFHKNYPGVNLKKLAAELINHDVPPGGDRAVLTLSSGKMIILNETADGKIGEEGGLNFHKIGNGQLRYEISSNGRRDKNAGFHSISTPKGGTYEISLPDGTIIWLNSASTLKFPVGFSTLKERKIELTGEAYLKVAKDLKHPFKVVTDQQVVQVLGSHFNIYNYSDEPVVKTTLVEGIIKVRSRGNHNPSSNEVSLKEGEQAIIDHGSVNTIKADTAEVLAWKNGWFVFNNESLESIMREVSRWYDVEVVYQNVDSNKIFSGKISRFEHVSAVLKLLESIGGVHFRIDKGKIIVMK